MFTKKFNLLLIVVLASLFAGCRTVYLGGDTAPPAASPAPPPAPIAADGVRTSYADVVEKTAAAVVRIESDIKAQQPQRTPFDDLFRGFPGQSPDRPQIQRGLGSGVIVSADGTIITNAHVIDGAEKITVKLLDNKSFDAKLVGMDKASDLAVLKIEAQNLPFLTFSNSDNVRVGDIVLAIGNPLGIGQTVTAGIISAKSRRTGLSDGQSYEDFLQTDAPINRGNSGGALVNLNGELIGINSQILSGSPSGGNIGIGFSIPSNMARSVLEQLLKDGKVRRGFLGVNIQTIDTDTAKALGMDDTRGVLVGGVQSGGPADKAGIKVGDIITAVNGEKVEDGNALRNRVAAAAPGSEVKLSLLRKSGNEEVSVTLGELNSETGTPQDPSQPSANGNSSPSSGKLGLSLQPLTPQTAKELGVDGAGGLVVTAVDGNGPAAAAGITRGDVVLEVNRQPVSSLEAVSAALNSAGDRPVLLLISRRGQTFFATVKP